MNDNHYTNTAELEPTTKLLPEKKLVYACLEGGVRDFLRLPTTKPDFQNLSGPYIRWVFSENDSIFSFLWCCDILGLAADSVRIRVINLKLAAGIDSQYVCSYHSKRSVIKGGGIEELCF